MNAQTGMVTYPHLCDDIENMPECYKRSGDKN